jgi:hypothetical protein
MSAIETVQAPAGWINSAEVMRRTGMSRVKLYRLAASGYIRTQTQIGFAPRYAVEDVQRYLPEQAGGGASRG